MKKIAVLFTLLLTTTVYADSVRFKAPAINGKLVANDLLLTDWQTVMSCHFNYRGQRRESLRYPLTLLKKLEGNVYSFKVKAGSLTEILPHNDLLTCAYKIILIGKNQNTHQLAFGEIYLMGKESGEMSESELQVFQEPAQVAKILYERTKELNITPGKEGGIVEDNQ